MGQPLYCSAAGAGEWGEAMVVALLPMRDSAVLPCFQGCLAFLHRHFPPQSPPSITLSVVNSSPRPWIAPQSLNSSSQPSTFQGTCVPVQDMYGSGKDCIILLPFRLPQISWFTLSLKSFSSDSDSCPNVGIGPLLQFPHPLRAGPVLLTLVSPPSSFILPSFAWVYIFFSAGQLLLAALSWCSACTSVFEGVFLMYP